MVFAQINNNVVVNTIVLDDMSLLPLFQSDPSGNPYDSVLQIDYVFPQPGISWTFDGIRFNPPVVPQLPQPLNIQYDPPTFGQLLINQFTASNSQRGMTSTQLFTLAQSLGPFYILLQCGSLQAFLDNISLIPIDGVMITTDIIAQFQGAVQAYLAGD